MGLILMRSNKGFTLIELMIAVAIIGILAAIAFPQYQNHIASAKIVEGMNTLVGLKREFEIDWAESLEFPKTIGGISKGGYDRYPKTPNVEWVHYNHNNKDTVWFSTNFRRDALPYDKTLHTDLQLHFGGILVGNDWIFLCGKWDSHGQGINDEWLPAGCNTVDLKTALDARAAERRAELAGLGQSQ